MIQCVMLRFLFFIQGRQLIDIQVLKIDRSAKGVCFGPVR